MFLIIMRCSAVYISDNVFKIISLIFVKQMCVPASGAAESGGRRSNGSHLCHCSDLCIDGVLFGRS